MGLLLRAGLSPRSAVLANSGCALTCVLGAAAVSVLGTQIRLHQPRA